ncbi:tol-pal system protein YbgF [Chitinibacter bivalviorum]|uniref:Cell division coordinator CpoB n=1 Tax=Chitinibacter bivalviorum TaxID=2739434 RepID=A0A7H9BP30_9NEIS|nr:tol-pal system protein YbgF [Chitinibacter bivalviorum]QLG89084.1 tol-pal system protein YbgF [Chitinibacter bivalviorum]
MKRLKLTLMAMVLAGMATQASAGLFDDDVARKQVADLAASVQNLQQQNQQRLEQLEASNKRVLDLVRQLDAQKEEIAKLRGANEVMQFNLDEAVKRQKDLYVDLDARLRTIEQAKMEAKAEAKLSEQESFDAAVALVQSKKFKEANAAWTRFAADYPKSDKMAAAQYWMGMNYAFSKDYKSANVAFNNVVANAPEDPKAPDSLLGLASVAAATGDKKASRNYLITIIEKYPQSEASAKAKKALAAPN